MTCLWEPDDELFCKSFFAGFLNQFSLAFVACILPFGAYQAVLYVVVYRVIEEERLLLNQSDLGSPTLQVNLMQIFITRSNST